MMGLALLGCQAVITRSDGGWTGTALSSTSGGGGGGSSGGSSSSSGGTSGVTGSTSGASGGGSTSGSGSGSTSSGGGPSCADGGVTCVGQVCDAMTGACVDCLSDADCAGKPHAGRCDPMTYTCVECLGPSDCPYHNPGCSGGHCGFCQGDLECPLNENCNNGSCACTNNGGCGGDAPVCLSSGVCGCRQSSDCAGGFICDPTFPNGACAESCATPGVCQGATPDCDLDSGICVECVEAAECRDAGIGKYCNPDNVCVVCQVPADCADAGAPYCVAGRCVQCQKPTDCPANAPGCDYSTGQCGSCTFDMDCPTGESCNGGSCG